MATIQIRDIPEEDAEELRRRAADAGMSLQSYMRQQVISLARRRTKGEILRAVRDTLADQPGSGADRDSIVRALQESRGE